MMVLRRGISDAGTTILVPAALLWWATATAWSQEPAAPTAPVEAKPQSAPAEAPKSENPSPPNAAEKTIVFNFSNAPWDAVLTRFAELADLSLVMEVRPPGTFSYSDQKPHTIPEAIDLLNGVLLGKDFIILRNDKFLALAPLDKPLPVDMVPRVTPTELGKYGKNEMVTVMLPLAHADPQKVMEEIKGVLSKHGTAVPLAQLKLLKITDLAGTLREVIPLAEKIDEQAKPKQPAPNPPPPPKVERILELKTLTFEKVLPALKVVFGGSEIAAGPASNKLIVVATETDQKRIEEFLNKLELPIAAGEANVQKAYPLARATAETLGEALQKIFPEDTTRARFTGDRNNNVLLVDAPPAVQERVKLVLQDLDQRPGSQRYGEKVYKPNHVPAANLLTTLESLFQRGDARFALDPTGEAIIIRATADDQERINKLLEEVDSASPEGGSLTELVLPLKFAKSATLATSLSTLFPPTKTAVTFTSDAQNNLLIVRCPEGMLARIKSLVEQVDQPAGLGNNAEFLYRPKHVALTNLVQTLQSLYPPASNVQAMQTPGGKAMLISAPKSIMDQVKASLELLDVPDEGPEEEVIKTYRLKSAKADVLVETLKKMLPKGGIDAKFIPDVANGQLVVAAEPPVQEKIAGLISELDKTPATDATVEIYSAKHVTPTTLLDTLKTIHGDLPGVRFSLDARARNVLVFAPPETHARIAATVKKVDVPPVDVEAKRVDEVYKLKFAQAVELAATLQKLYPPTESDVTISHDAANNVVIVTAPEELQKKIAQLIERIDVPAESRLIEKLYTPKKQDAVTLMTTIQSLYNRDGKSTFGLTAGNKTIVALAPAMVHKKIEELIAKLDQQEDPNADLEQKVYKIRYGNVSYLAQSLAQVFPPATSRASVTPDPANNVLIVSAPPAVQEKIAHLIESADVPAQANMEEKILRPKNLPAASFSNLLQSLYSGQQGTRISVDQASNSLVVVAPAEIQAKVKALTEQLDQPADAAEGQERRLYPMKHGTAYYAYSTLTTLFPASETPGRFSYDSVANVVVVIGTPALHEKVKTLLKELDVDPRGDVVEKTFVLKNTSAVQVLPLVRQALASEPKTTITQGTNGQRIIILAPPAVQERAEKVLLSLDVAPEEGEQPLEVVYTIEHASAPYVYSSLTTLFPAAETNAKFNYDPTANTVLVIAPSAIQERVKTLVKQMDVPGKGQVVDRIFTPKNQPASELVTLLRQTLAAQPNTSVTLTPNGQQILVLALESVQKRAEQSLATLDAAVPAEQQLQEAVYSLKNASAGQVYSSLSNLFPASTTGARYGYDPSANTVIVMAPADLQAKIKKLVSELDVPPRGQVVEKLYEIKNAPAPRVATSLRQALSNQPSTTVTVTPDGRQLLVVAPTDVQEKAVTLLEKLDQPPPEGEEKVRELYRLKYANASQLAASLQALYPTTDFPTMITYDSTNNVVIVEAPASLQTKIKDLVAEVDLPSGGKMEMVYALEHRKSDELLNSLTAMLSSSPNARVVSGPDKKSLIVVGNADDQARAADFLKKFDQPAPDQELERRLYRLRFSKAPALANSLQTLFANDSTARITYEIPNNAVVVLAKPEVHRQVQDLVNEFDKPAPDKPRVEQVFSLKHASPNALLGTLRQVFEDPELAKFSADENAGTILASTVPDLSERVAETIQQMDQPKRQAEREVEVVNLREVDPFSAENVIEGMFDDLRQADRPTVESVFDPPRLVIRASSEQMKEIRAVLSRMGEDVNVHAGGVGQPAGANPPEGADALPTRPTTRTLRLNSGDPRTVAEAIEKLWPKLRQNPLYLVASGRVGDVEPVEPQKPLPSQEKPKEQSKPEENGDAGKEPRPLDKSIPVADLPGNPKMPVFITPGVNRLVVTTKDPEAMLLVEQLTDSLTEIPDYDQGEFTIFYLHTAGAEDVAKAIDEAFNGKQSDNDGSGGRGRSRFARRDRVRVVPDTTANALIVRASPVDLLNVQRLIESLDQTGLAESNARQPRIIPLKEASAEEVMQVLQTVYKDYLAPGSGGPLNLPGFAASVGGRGRTAAISVGIDARSNSLVVLAPDPLFKQIESLVQSLQQVASETGRTYRVLPLRHSNPIEVRDALEILLDREPIPGTPGAAAGSSRSRPTRQRPSTRSRRPGVPSSNRSRPAGGNSGEPLQLPDGLAAVDNADVPTKGTKITTIRSTESGVTISDDRPKLMAPTVVAANADAKPADEEIVQVAAQIPAEAIQDSRLSSIAGNVVIKALPDLGVVLLLGSETDLVVLGEVVAAIEKVARDEGLMFRIVPLDFAKAAPLAELLDDMYERLLDARGVPTLAQAQAVVLPLASANALLLAAPREDLNVLEGLARKFDVENFIRQQHRVIRLKHARALDVTQTITKFYANRASDGEMAPEVIVDADERSNSVLVHAAPGDLRQVEGLIAELDVQTTESVNSLRVFPLRFTVAQEMARVLENAIHGGTGAAAAAVTAAAGRNRTGPALQLLTLDPDTNRTVNSGILDTVRITPNERANTLIVSAPAMTMDLIEALIRQLDVLPEAQSEVKVFTLENSDALTMVQTLRSLFAQLQGASNQVSVTAPTGTIGPPTATGGTEGGSPLIELTFSVDERTNSILVSGSRQQLEMVEAIVIRLDGSDIEGRKTEVYRLKNAGAVEVASALTLLLEQQTNLAQLQEGLSLKQQIEQEVVVVPETISNSLLISSSPRFYDKLIALIEKIDAAPPQVVIQVLIVQVDLENNEELGVELGLQDSILFNRGIYPGTATLTPPFTQAGVSANPSLAIPGQPGYNFNNQPLGNNPFVPGSNQVGTQGLGSFNLGRNSNLGYGGFVFSASSESVSVLIRALAQERRLEVLSRPQIMTVDNQEAFIQVGQQIPLITDSVIQAQGGVVNTVTYQDVGIILQVLPKINPDGSVVMQVNPEISALAPVSDVNARVEVSTGVFARAINTTRAHTVVSATNGQTAVIGGLIRKETEVETRKVPYLGDIPVVGTLFRYDRQSIFKRELIILLTPHVVRNELEAEQIKQLEAARMDWCLENVEKIQGPIGLPGEAPEEGAEVIEDGSMETDSELVPEGGAENAKGEKKKLFPWFSRKDKKKPSKGNSQESIPMISTKPGDKTMSKNVEKVTEGGEIVPTTFSDPITPSAEKGKESALKSTAMEGIKDPKGELKEGPKSQVKPADIPLQLETPETTSSAEAEPTPIPRAVAVKPENTRNKPATKTDPKKSKRSVPAPKEHFPASPEKPLFPKFEPFKKKSASTKG
ncbi:MAG: secretin N-terminal domain-containing protein [Planctomycetota bacterium]